ALYRADLGRLFVDRAAFEQFVRDLGAWGPAIIILAQVLQVVMAPIPGQVVGLAAGYLYGLFWGTVLSMIGLVIGTALAVWLTRTLGRPLVERLASPKTLARLDDYAERRGVAALLAIYLLPFLPDDVACFAAGLMPIPIRRILVVAVIGRSLGIIVSSWLGTLVHDLAWPHLVVMAVLALIGAVLVARYRERLEQIMFGILDRLYKKP
ncbi:MAG: TVP38/TMEM64 family protein, partial [Anaerolineae bacterium]